jgi:hypothetical protein
LHYFSPLPFSPRINPAGGFRVPRPNIAFSPHVKAAKSGRGGVGGGLGSPLAGFSPNTEISFLMISPNFDICPIFLLAFSLLETADLLNYSSLQVMAILCCVAKKAASVAQKRT